MDYDGYGDYLDYDEDDFSQEPSEHRENFYDMVTAYMNLNMTERKKVGFKFKDMIFNCEYRGADCNSER